MPSGNQAGPPSDVTAFPAQHWAANERIFRVSGQDTEGTWRSPWWFCTLGDCRFDLPPASDTGTMYGATDATTCVLEFIGPQLSQVVTRDFLSTRRICELAYDTAIPLANLADARCVSFGVTNELSSMPDYSVPQAWAAAFARDGFDGIAFRARHAPHGPATAVAVFDEAGSHDWPICDTWSVLTDDVINQLSAWGVRVATAPRLAQLAVVGSEAT